MLEQFLPQTSFSSYEELISKFRIDVPTRFNFAWDVVDVIAEKRAWRRALVWCDEKGDEAAFTFGQMAELSIARRHLLPLPGHWPRGPGHADPQAALRVLVLPPGAAPDRGNRHSGHAPSDEEGYRLPQQCGGREGHRLRERCEGAGQRGRRPARIPYPEAPDRAAE